MAGHHHDEISIFNVNRPSEGRFLAAVWIAVGVALGLSFYRIGAFELWLDEAYTFRQMVVSDWLSSYLADNSPPFYNLLMRGWGYLAGYSELALRAPSALCGSLFVGVAMVAGRCLFDKRTGYWCGIIAAVLPIHLYYSQEARNYALLMLLLLLAWLFLCRAQYTMTWRDWLIAGLCALLAIFTHYLAVLALLPTLLLVCCWPEPATRAQRLRRYLALTIPMLLLLSLWMFYSLLLRPHSMSGFGWMARIWQQTPPLLAPLRTIEAFSFVTGPHLMHSMGGFAGYQKFVGEGTLLLVLRLTTAVLLLWVVLPFGDRALGISRFARRKVLLMAAFLCPLLCLWIISPFVPLYMVSRYDLVAFPAFVILVGLSFAKLQAQGRFGFRLALLIGGLCLIPLGVFLREFYRIPVQQRHRPTAELLSERVSSSDVVVFTGNRSFVSRYYLSRLGYRCEDGFCDNASSGHRFPYRQYPTANEQEEAVYNRSEIMEDPGKAGEELKEFLAMRGNSRAAMWLVVRGSLEDDLATLRFRPDKILLDTISVSNIFCRVMSSDLFVLACYTP